MIRILRTIDWRDARDRAIAILIVFLVIGATVFAFLRAIGDLG